MRRISAFLTLLLLVLSAISFAQENGSQKNIAELTFTGNKKTKSDFLYRLVKVKIGQALDKEKIELDIERLKRLDGIAFAEYTIKDTENGYLVNYDLVENFSIIPGLRIGQANDDSFSFRASVFEFNGLGRNITYGGFYQREVFDSFGFFIEHPYLLTNKLGLGFNYQDLTTQQPIFFPTQQVNYTFRRRGPEIKLFYELNFNNRFELSSKIFKEEYEIIEGDPQNAGKDETNTIEPSANKAMFRAQHEYVDIDLEYHQISGFQNTAELQYFSGNTDILRTEYIFNNTSSYYRRIGKKGNWASRLQLSLSNDVEKDESSFVPIVIDNQLNVRGAGNTPARGTASIAFNTEYRHTLIEKDWFVLQSNTFLDVAGVRKPGEDFGTALETNNLKVYPGIGIRLIHKRIFNAVIRIDYGFRALGRLNNEQVQESGIVFGIGQYF